MRRKCDVVLSKQIIVGLRRIGLMGLREAFQKADESGLGDREEILDLILEMLSTHEYIPDSEAESYRQALWREYMRFRGEDISDLYSTVDVVVRGTSGEERDRFVDMLTSTFGGYELKPVVTFEPPDEQGPNPQLLLEGVPVIKGCISREKFKLEIRKHITHW